MEESRLSSMAFFHEPSFPYLQIGLYFKEYFYYVKASRLQSSHSLDLRFPLAERSDENQRTGMLRRAITGLQYDKFLA
jgi:hypothetical protein